MHRQGIFGCPIGHVRLSKWTLLCLIGDLISSGPQGVESFRILALWTRTNSDYPNALGSLDGEGHRRTTFLERSSSSSSCSASQLLRHQEFLEQNPLLTIRIITTIDIIIIIQAAACIKLQSFITRNLFIPKLGLIETKQQQQLKDRNNNNNNNNNHTLSFV